MTGAKKSDPAESDPKLPLVIVNPKSAGGATQSKWAGIAADLRAHFGPFNVAFTTESGDGTDIAARAVAGGTKFIIACGGDGTINEIANGILQTGEEIELGVLPSGTGGDFRKTLGIPVHTRDAAKALREGETRTIDAGKVTFADHEGRKTSRYFLNVSSFGLSVSINQRVKKRSLLNWLPAATVRGTANFAISTLQEVLESDFLTVRIKLDDLPETNLNTINFAVCNAQYFGGGMWIAPGAKLDDGLLHVINIGDIKTARILLHAYKLYGGSHLDLKEVKSFLAKRIEVSPFHKGEIINIEVDGELPGSLPAVYEVVPGALKIRVPKNG